MIIVLLLPCTLIDASMLIEIGVGVVLSQMSSSSVFVSTSLSGWMSSWTESCCWSVVYGGGGETKGFWFCMLAATSPSLI